MTTQTSVIMVATEEMVTETQQPKRTPLDVAIGLLDSRWLRPFERDRFQEEVGYAQQDVNSSDRVIRSAGFERARELTVEMRNLINPRWEAARQLRREAEAIVELTGCSIEQGFERAKEARRVRTQTSQDSHNGSHGGNTAAKRAQQLARKRARTPAAKGGSKK